MKKETIHPPALTRLSQFAASNKLLLAIIVLATLLRLWNLDTVPPNASLDEASIGWNAYSVLKTGSDEFGQFPLISQRGYDDWRRSTYLLMTIPVIALRGLDVVAVRLPAVILSILTVAATYTLTRALFAKQSPRAHTTALAASLLLAINPWHIYISRLGHESNACLSFLVFAMTALVVSIRYDKWTYLATSGILFTLSVVSYYSGQALIPLLLACIGLLFQQQLLQIIRKSNVSKVVFLIVLLAFTSALWSVFSPEALIRFRGTSTLSPEAHPERFAREVLMRNEAATQNDIVGMLWYNRRLFPAKMFVEGYLQHFSPAWLFANRGAENHKVPDIGLLYLWEAPLILVGLLLLIRTKRIALPLKALIIVWLLAAPLPAALATQAPHAMRAYNILPTWQILGGLTISYLLQKGKSTKLITATSLAILILLSVIQLRTNYFQKFPAEQSQSFQYALARTIEYVEATQANYDKVIFSNSDNLYQSYMHFLFQTRFDPVLYREYGGTKSAGYEQTHKFGKYEFRPVTSADKTPQTLLVTNPQEVTDTPALFTANYLDGSVGVTVK